jgi:hypothetical protein
MKAMKTSILCALVIALALGRLFLGSFRVPKPCRVLFLTGESGAANIKDTLLRICKSYDLTESEMEALDANLLTQFDLPTLSNRRDLDRLGRFLKEKQIDVVIVDPVYVCMEGANGKDVNPANVMTMGRILSRIAAASLDAGATPILCWHFNRTASREYAEPQLTDLVYAGAAEFARQWILLRRRERYADDGNHKLWLRLGGSQGHQSIWHLDINEGVRTAENPTRVWDPTVNTPAQGRQAERHQREENQMDREAQRAVEERNRKTELICRAEARLGQFQRNHPDADGMTINALMKDLKVKQREGARDAFKDDLSDSGKFVFLPIKSKSGTNGKVTKEVEGIRLAGEFQRNLYAIEANTEATGR